MTHTRSEYWERKRLGLCTHCGRVPSNATRTLCTSCHIKKLTYNRRAKRNQLMTAKQLQQKRVGDVRYRAAHPKRLKRSAKASRDKLKQQVISHYGGHCACCGESEIAFLTIDHINNDGRDDRMQLTGFNKGGSGFYRSVRQRGYPTGYQVLCWNCNLAKALYGSCPHNSKGPRPQVSLI